MLVRPVMVTKTALNRMLRTHNLGAAHPVIEAEPVFVDHDGDREADDAMWAEFRELRLVDHRNRLDGDLLDTLGVLARPSVEYFGWFEDDKGNMFGVLVAASGDEGVIAVRVNQRVRLGGIRAESLPETLVSQLPDVPAARIDAVNIRLSDVDGDINEDDVMVAGRQHVEKDIATLRLLKGQQVTGLGELYTGVRDGWGRYATSRNPVRYRDTRQGRVLVSVSDGYLSIAPATPKLLAVRLRKAQYELPR